MNEPVGMCVRKKKCNADVLEMVQLSLTFCNISRIVMRPDTC